MQMKKLVLFVMILFVLTACSGAGSSSPVGEWKLVSYGPPANQTRAAMGVDTSITFASNGQLMGDVGCNSFSGEYGVNGDQITFQPIVSTLMACEDPIGTQEQQVFATLTDTVNFQIAGDTFTITSVDGGLTIVLERK
jgi:heat shock protein HslJ